MYLFLSSNSANRIHPGPLLRNERNSHGRSGQTFFSSWHLIIALRKIKLLFIYYPRIYRTLFNDIASISLWVSISAQLPFAFTIQEYSYGVVRGDRIRPGMNSKSLIAYLLKILGSEVRTPFTRQARTILC